MDTSSLPETATTREIAEALGVSMPVVQYWVRHLGLTPVLKSGLMRWFDQAAQQALIDAIQGAPRQLAAASHPEQARDLLMKAQRERDRAREARLTDYGLKLATLEGRVDALFEQRPPQPREAQSTHQALEALRRAVDEHTAALRELQAFKAAQVQRQAQWEDYLGWVLVNTEVRLQAMEEALGETVPMTAALSRARILGQEFLVRLQNDLTQLEAATWARVRDSQ